MKIEDIVASILKSEINPDEEIYYIANPGNAGDALINLANFDILKKLKISFKTIFAQDDFNAFLGKTVVYCPAGNLVKNYADAKEIIRRSISTTKKLIILPCTVRGNENTIEMLQQNVIFMCRDQETFDHVKKNASASLCVIDAEDMALTLNAKEIVSRPPGNLRYIFHQLDISIYHGRHAMTHTLSWLYLHATHSLRTFFGKETINVFRNDSEKTLPPPKDNLDISAYLENNDMSEVGVRITSYRFLKFLNLYQTINTNRLHAAIGALLLGKSVNFFDNSYGKNLAVYERSLKRRFPGKITWKSATTFN